MTDTTAPIDQVVDLLRQLHLPHMRRQAPDCRRSRYPAGL
jgi:hypothetical protein